jgi:hypothetical protein
MEEHIQNVQRTLQSKSNVLQHVQFTRSLSMIYKHNIGALVPEMGTQTRKELYG